MALRNNSKILINCLLLSQCSGGYRSYFKNVIIPLTHKLNTEKITTRVLIPECCKNEYEHFFNPEHLLVDVENKKGLMRIFYEHKQIPYLVSKHNFTKVYTPYQIGPVKIKDAESILMFRNMEPYVAANYKYPLKNKIRSLFLRKLCKFYLNRADKVIAVSEFTKNFIVNEEGINPQKITVIPHGIKQPVTHETGNEEEFILAVGSLMPYRRLEDLINAFNIFRKQVQSQVQIKIVGGGMDKRYKEKIKEMIENSPFRNDIILKGEMPHEQVVDLFLKSKLFVMTSEVEACPNTALEAMSLGCAIISSENQPMPEFFDDAVKYYPYRDANQLAQQIAIMLSDSEMRQLYKDKAKERSKKYTWEETISKTECILK